MRYCEHMSRNMATRYISDRTAYLYNSSTTSSRNYIFIYGDEVKTSGTPRNNRIKSKARNSTGWVNKAELQKSAPLEMYFIDVGQGDSTFIVTPKRKTILVDGGENDRAFRFLAWKYRLWEVSQNKPVVIDLMVISHADGDHIKGLIPIIESPKIKIKRIIHSGLGLYKKDSYHNRKLGRLETHDGTKYIVTSHSRLSELDGDKLRDVFVDWKTAIQNKGGINYGSVNSNTGQINIGDPKIKLDVIGPHVERESGISMYKWFGDHAHTINGHSVVLRLTYNKVKILLSGDLNGKASDYLISSGYKRKMDAHVLKAPHHGSGDYSYKWLESVNPQVSIISSGDDPDHGHPRANFIAAIGRASRSSKNSLVFSTEIAATFQRLSKAERKRLKITKKDLHHLTDSQYNALRKMFKRRLHGMINVRTNGITIYAARRVNAGYMWESYGGYKAANRSIPI